MTKRSILDLSPAELSQNLQELGQPKFRLQQVIEGLYKHHYESFDRFPNLPKKLTETLNDSFTLDSVSLVTSIRSRDRKTEKYLFTLHDQHKIETVLMKYDKRNTVCISSQVGCPLGCVFCSTGQMGFSRNLSSGEILGQVLYIMRLLENSSEKLTNVVYMGMGEPLLNYASVMESIDRLTDPALFNFGARRITISTVGIVPKIREFTSLNSQVNLAVSLHAPTDELRSQLVPNNRLHPLKPLIAACREYVDTTRRRTTFEYALIQDINDNDLQARQFVNLLKGILCHVNLIALNPSKEYPLPGSTRDRVDAFLAVLQQAGIPASIRMRRGIDIDAGCGQLAQSQHSE
ncbi:MAG: 23S rRNA (adenine(2503)-C(2))-methyltransferase RlmN [Chloroflexi bacterium]|jgi:23S rRNA (adenine2503-C2)-methyltransferase|nr:23S rRNA (adenine(2503)-C(2))-methyltransferase RlmN [Chloroflexota bacterium]